MEQALPMPQGASIQQQDRGRKSGGREGEYGLDKGVTGMALAVRAAGVAGPGAGTQRLIDDALDGARAAATFGAAPKAAIELLGAPRKVVGGVHGVADVVITQHVAGTDDH